MLSRIVPVVESIVIPETVGAMEYCSDPVPPPAEIEVIVSPREVVVVMTVSAIVSESAVLTTMLMPSSAVTPIESVTRTVSAYVPATTEDPMVIAPVEESMENPDGVETSEKVLVPVPPDALEAESVLVNPAVLVSSAGAVRVSAPLTVKETVALSV